MAGACAGDKDFLFDLQVLKVIPVVLLISKWLNEWLL
jgi:hypothetical protein